MRRRLLRLRRRLVAKLKTPTTTFIAGWALIVAGVGLISIAAALIVGGAVIVAGAVLAELGGDE